MKILVVNDDGIEAEGIRELASWASGLGEVTVVAPATQQSAKSHSINIYAPFHVRSVDWLPAVKAITVDSTPADCVRIAEKVVKGRYDLVLSGINRGYNVGADIAYSGTCAAIFEAAYCGWPAVAFSAWPDDAPAAARQLDRIWDFIQSRELLKICPLLNVNIPPEEGKIYITRQGGPYYKDEYLDQGEDMVKAHGFSVHDGSFDPEKDLDVVLNGHISITPLSVNRTDEKAYQLMRQQIM